MEFQTGDKVEVSSDDEGFRGAHFGARVARSHPNLRRYTVVYDALLSDKDQLPLREVVDSCHVRPRPPPRPPRQAHDYRECDVVDTLWNDAWWVGVVAGPTCRREESSDGNKVVVCFPETKEVMEFGEEEVRSHLEWVDGKWIEQENLEIPRTLYDIGTEVEVAKLKENSVIAWLPAVVSKMIWKDNFLIEYKTLKSDTGTEILKELINLQHIRPCPPCSSAIHFCINDEVEAFFSDGWWPGVITEVHQGSIYTFKSVHLNKEIQLGQKLLRLRYNWENDQWIAAPQKKMTMKFTKGTKVEVRSDDEGLHGAWYGATILKPVGNNFLVMYQTLRTDDESVPLVETVDIEHIRPSPPHFPVTDTFKLFEEVDAFHNEGWWIGIISKVMSGPRYKVYFRPWNEEREFGHEQLRLHCDLVGGRWMQASQGLAL